MLKGRDIVLNAFTDLLDYLCRCRELKEYICVILNTDVGPKGNAVNKIKKNRLFEQFGDCVRVL